LDAGRRDRLAEAVDALDGRTHAQATQRLQRGGRQAGYELDVAGGQHAYGQRAHEQLRGELFACSREGRDPFRGLLDPLDLCPGPNLRAYAQSLEHGAVAFDDAEVLVPSVSRPGDRVEHAGGVEVPERLAGRVREGAPHVIDLSGLEADALQVSAERLEGTCRHVGQSPRARDVEAGVRGTRFRHRQPGAVR